MPKRLLSWGTFTFAHVRERRSEHGSESSILLNPAASNWNPVDIVAASIDLAPVLERSKRQTTYQHSLENNVQHVYGHVHVVRGRLWCPGLMPRAGHCQILSAGIQDLVLVAPYKGSRRRPPGRNLGKEGMKPDAGVLSGMRACHLSHPARARANKDGMQA